MLPLLSFEYGLLTVHHLQDMHKDRFIIIKLLINHFGWRFSVIRVEYYISNQLYKFFVCIHYLHVE